MNKEKIEEYVKQILIELGADINSEGIQETPKRVANMYEEVFCGMNYTNHDIATMFDKTFEEEYDVMHTNNIVILKDIDMFSYCEHHMALMYDMKATVAYIPKSRVIGLSKIARICDMVGRRLQIQERIGKDIADIIFEITKSEDIAVIIEGYHGCMTVRGIKKNHCKTTTFELRGRFKNELQLLELVK